MKRYYIEIYYQTGNSFNTYDETSNLELEWDKLDVAKENLKRIKDYYAWYEDNRGFRVYIKKNDSRISKPKCVNTKYDTSIDLITDDGKDIIISVYWCGFFEVLYSAKIKERGNAELEFITDRGECKQNICL